MPEWCAWCFFLREPQTGRRIGTAADDSWVLSSEASATIMYRLTAGETVDEVWQPHPHLYTLLPGIGERCATFTEGAIVWAACPEATRFHFATMNVSGGGGGRASSMLPSSSVVGVPSSSNSTSYMGVSAAASEESTQPILLVGAASEAVEFEWQCVPCPGREFTGEAAGWVFLIAFLAILPVLLIAGRRLQKHWFARPSDVTGQQWPRAARSNCAWSFLLLGWVTMLLGFTPMILSTAGGWWTGVESYYLVLGVVGILEMEMFVRDDDPKWLFRTVMKAMTVAFMGGTSLNSVYIITLVQNLIQHLSAVDTVDAPIGSGLETFGPTRYGLYARLVPQLGKTILLTAVNAVFIIPNLAALLRPLVCRRAASEIGVSTIYSETGARAAHRLWRHMRTAWMGLALSLLGTFIATIVLAAVMQDSAYPSELERTRRSLVEDGTLGAVFLLAYAFSSPQTRLRIHLPRRRKFVNTLVLDAESALPSGSPSPPLVELTVTVGQIEAPINADTAGAGDGTAGASSARPSSSAAAVPNMADELIYGPAWTDVDVSAWQDHSGRFDGMRVGQLVGFGGYSRVFLAEVPPRPGNGGDVGDGGDGDPVAGLVAVKVLHRWAYKDEKEIGNLRREMTIALEVSHPHLVRTFGTVLINGWPGLVMELKSRGSLAQLLHGPSTPSSHTPSVAPHTTDLLYTTSSTANGEMTAKFACEDHGSDSLPPKRQGHGRPVLTAEFRVRLVHEVLSGLAYLHELSIVHRDIKSANVLLDDDLHAAVCDFSISTRFGMEHTMGVGTLRYMAPEVCFGPYDASADVFAYAMLLWETFHIAVPFAESNGLKAIMNMREGQRPPIQLPPPLDRYEELIHRCWHHSPEVRPSMAKTLALLEGLMAGSPGAHEIRGV